MPSIEDALKEAYASAPSNVAILETLEISHPDIEDTIYIVKNREDLTFTLEDDSEHLFEGVAFRMTLPATGENGLQDLNISIDNVDRRISDFLETVKQSKEPVMVKYRPYLSTDLTAPQMIPPLTLSLKGASIGTLEVESKASFADIINKKFPNDYYTRKRFPSLGQ